MKGNKFKYSVLIFCATAVFVLPTHAYAYIDPGTGSMILQGLIAAFALAAATITIWWAKIKNFLTQRSHSSGRDRKNAVADGNSKARKNAVADGNSKAVEESL